MTAFSVLMAVYARESAENFAAALDSVVNQTLPPNEIVVVKDGPLTPELDRVLKRFADQCGLIKEVSLPKNGGLGAALNAGLAACSHDIVARMDSDDISVPKRFEKQIDLLYKKPSLSLVGSNVAEFKENPDTITGIRAVPELDDAVRSTFARISPVNHPSVVYRRLDVLRCGGYSPEYSQEDYHLWGKMLASGYLFENLQESLVLMRTGDGLHQRRGGFNYARSEARLQREFVRMGLISRWQYVSNVVVRYAVRTMPVGVRRFVYATLLRRRQ